MERWRCGAPAECLSLPNGRVSKALECLPLRFRYKPGAAAADRPQFADVSCTLRPIDVRFTRINRAFAAPYDEDSVFPSWTDEKWKLGRIDDEFQILSLKPGLAWPALPALAKLHLGDFVCNVRARIASAPAGGWGLGLLRGKSGDLQVGILVDDQGRIATRGYSDGHEDDHEPGVRSSAMHPVNEWNTFHIEVTGSRVRIFVNGQFLGDRQHPRERTDNALCLFTFGDQAPKDLRIGWFEVQTF